MRARGHARRSRRAGDRRDSRAAARDPRERCARAPLRRAASLAAGVGLARAMTFYEDTVRRGLEETERYVSVERGADRAVVTLEDPDKLNVLTAPLVQQLKAALSELVSERSIRSIVLTGADPGFSAGGDLRMMEEAPEALASPPG